MDPERGEKAFRWLRALAEDVLEHESCRGCRYNAAQALDELGLLSEVLTKLGIEVPRHAWDARPGDTGDAYRSRLTIKWEEE